MSRLPLQRLSAIALALFVSACTSRYRVDPATLRAKIPTAASVTLSDGTEGDYDELKRQRAEVIVGAATEIDRTKGAFQGLGIGALAGIGTGLVFLAAVGSSCEDGYTRGHCVIGTAAGAGIIAAAGPIIGLVTGIAVGAKNVYELEATPTVSATADGGTLGLSFRY